MQIRSQNLTRQFAGEAPVLENLSICFESGQWVGIGGPSGGGKSTLLNIIALLDAPCAGELFLDGQATALWTPKEKNIFRAKNIGFVFQDYALLPKRCVWENIALPLLYQGYRISEAKSKALSVLETMGCLDWADRPPHYLSGGQQQRVSIARAVVHQPKLLVADEPTAALDPKTQDDILDLFELANQQWGCTIVLVSHDTTVLNRCHVQYQLEGGALCG